MKNTIFSMGFSLPNKAVLDSSGESFPSLSWDIRTPGAKILQGCVATIDSRDPPPLRTLAFLFPSLFSPVTLSVPT